MFYALHVCVGAWCSATRVFLKLQKSHTHTHTHINIYIYI